MLFATDWVGALRNRAPRAAIIRIEFGHLKLDKLVPKIDLNSTNNGFKKDLLKD